MQRLDFLYRRSLFFAYFGICLGLLVGVFAALWTINHELRVVRNRALSDQIAPHRHQAIRLAGYIEAMLSERQVDDPSDISQAPWLKGLWTRYAIIPKELGFAAIVNRDNIIVKHTQPPLEDGQIDRHWYDHRMTEAGPDVFLTSHEALTGGKAVYVVVLPLRVQSLRVADLHYGVNAEQVHQSVEAELSGLERGWNWFLVALFLAAAAASIGLIVIGRHVSRLHGSLSGAEQRRDNDLRRLSSVLAHRLRNPLHALRLNLHVFRRINDLPSSDVAGLVGESNLQIDRADRVLQELAEYAELDEPKNEVVDVNEVVDAVATLIGRETAKKSVDLNIVKSSQPACVRMDPTLLRQILLCLLNNAQEAVAERGRIAMHVAVTKKHVEIVVSDDGAGIPPALRDRIFEPFFTTKENSCGAGLAVLRRRVNQADGFVEYEPNEPRGSKFRVTLPAHTKRAA